MPSPARQLRPLLRPLARPASRRLAAVQDARLLAMRDQMAGRTVWVLASGPSLTAEDVAQVQACRATRGDRVIVTNTTTRLAPWADVLFAHDIKWLEKHPAEIAAATGLIVSMSGQLLPPRVASAKGVLPAYKNAGVCAISLGLWAGAARIIGLGLDCQPDAAGNHHWHGRHPSGLGDALSLLSWPERFAKVADEAKDKGIPVINASRATALTCFPRVTLEAVTC